MPSNTPTVRRPVGRPANWELREKIFRAIARGGAVRFQTSTRIGNLLGKSMDAPPTAVTLNNHLRFLDEAGFIEVVGMENAPGRGRPAKVYDLTPLGQVVASFRK